VSLTPEQLDAVERAGGAFTLVAPPGSGKTEVLVRRVIWLLQTSQGEMFRILALTFTHKAAEELRRRVELAIGQESWRVTATTFHSFALDMLQHYGTSVGMEPDVTIFESDEDRADALLRGLIDDQVPIPEEEIDPTHLRGIIARIDLLKADLVMPERASAARIAELNVTLRDAYTAYESALSGMGAIDFSGLLLKAYELLTTDAWVANHYRKLYRFTLIDEAQDTNRAQYYLIRAFCGDEYRNVYVAADVDQSIFAFAGASPRHVQQLEKDLGASRLFLTHNFRSARSIVEAAGHLAEHFRTTSVRQPMVPATLAPGWVGAWATRDEVTEATVVVEWLQSLLDSGLDPDWGHGGEDPRLKPEDICVIGRTRYSFDALTLQLTDRNINYLIRTEEGGLFDSDLWRAAYYSLRLLANPRDVPSYRRLVSLVQLEDEDFTDDASPQETVKNILRRVSPEAGRFVAEVLVGSEAPTAIDQIAESLLSLDLDVDGVDDITRALWRSDQGEFARCWRQYELRSRPESRSLADFLRSLSRLQRTAVEDPGVRILTPYRAKGLEFKVVVIIGLNEGTFPHYRSLDSEEHTDEERRSVYVAATRAARALLLTRAANQVTRYGSMRVQAESRFVKEMGLQMATRSAAPGSGSQA
jgi:DNA helicase-2/ATP-dependent DNA helicase PcrA